MCMAQLSEESTFTLETRVTMSNLNVGAQVTGGSITRDGVVANRSLSRNSVCHPDWTEIRLRQEDTA